DAAHDNPPIVFPEVRFHTNDAWTLIRGVAHAKGFPILLMNRYSRGVLYVLTIPDNPGDLYSLPRGVTSVIKSYLQPGLPVRIDAPGGVSLFTYDNGTFIVQSFLPTAQTVNISVAGTEARLRDLLTNAAVPAAAQAPATQGRARQQDPRTTFAVDIQPHSYAGFELEAP